MDARALLRRYIEQRRELGESELVLDRLNVEEVMQLLGAAGTRPVTLRPPSLRDAPHTDSTDWRSSLRQSGVDVETPAPSVQREPVIAPAPIAPAVEEENADRDAEDPHPTTDHQLTEDMAFKRGLVVGDNDVERLPEPIAKLRSLKAIAEKVQECTRCPLYATATNGVPGEGDPHAGLMCVGEAPGANEDATGRPFVGQAGGLLTKILAAIDLTREQVFIVNVLKHRPPGNRNPRPEEVEACSPYLIRQIELIKPKVIVAFGTFAAQTLLNTKTPIGKLRGLVHRYHGTPLIVTYHPAALLRNPAWKRPTWEDVKLARRILDSASPS
ncbi:MAG TPA: uracil-DNA glycosylase family protein [Gemmatimonadaceae bacterium]|nr:uracil-DNA glycosylase family protein [Gemmatimonadaceae bacterium]